ncbi:MAG: FAD-dependent oxidoreductase [Pseudomonadota bacterium]
MNIAVIGGGIAGLSAAYLLQPQHQVTLYEQAPVPGGHSRTCQITTPDGEVAVDTGFIVFNRRNYPQLTALFQHLQVPIAESAMSFGVSIDQGRLEYSTRSLAGLFAQPGNLLRCGHWRLLRDILRFNRHAKPYLVQRPDASLAKCLSDLQLSPEFRDYYLLAMSAAIWSTPAARMQQMPASTLIRFFDNHGLLTVNDQPQWYTVRGGSRNYVQRLTDVLHDTRCDRQVTHVARNPEGITVTCANGEHAQYDQVILACHSDQALRLLETPTPAEQAVLGAIRYQPNRAILHRDLRFMPRRRRAWSSWVYLSDHTTAEPTISLTYWMNNLQPLGTRQPILVTLNPSDEPDPALTYDQHMFAHPLLDAAAIAAQKRLPEIQGQDRLWYCGAWQGYGFHEDGLRSAIEVATRLGAQVPWG